MSIPHRRLTNQLIAGEKAESPPEAVRRLGALQAQDYHQAVWAIGCRMRSAVLPDIEKSIADKEIIQTWPMRGTIHFVPAEDARWMVKLLAPRALAHDKRRLEQLELSPDTVERAKEIVGGALSGRDTRTRSALMAALEEAGIRTKGQRGYHLLWHAAQAGIIALGPREGKEQTFVLLDEWLTGHRELQGEEALAVLAERYFTGHGPATARDFAYWSGLALKEARNGIEAAGARLRSETIDGEAYWTHASVRAGPAANGPSVFLMPGFDEYMLGYKERRDVLREEHANAVVPGGNGVFKPFVLIDGQISGVWQRTIKRKSIDIEIRLFTSDQAREAELKDAAARYCAFMELPPGSIEIRPPA